MFLEELVMPISDNSDSLSLHYSMIVY